MNEVVTVAPSTRLVTVPVGAASLMVRGAVLGAEVVAVTGVAGARLAARLPFVGRHIRRVGDVLARTGERTLFLELPVAIVVVKILVARVVADIVATLDLTSLVKENVDLDAIADAIDLDRIIDRLDFDAIIRDRVDVNAVARQIDLDGVARLIDVNAVAGRVDVDAIIDRVDLVGLASMVIDDVDLPRIIRESTMGVTTEVVADVRVQGEQADDTVARVMSRLLRRKEIEAPTIEVQRQASDGAARSTRADSSKRERGDRR